MISRRKHICFGIFGVYMFFLMLYMLASGLFQTINTIRHYAFLGLIGPDRIDYGEYAAYMFIRFALFMSVSLVQLTIGGFTIPCLIVTPSAEQIRRIAYLFCLLALCMIVRGFIAGAIGIMTFMGIPNAVLFFIMFRHWDYYQESFYELSGEKKREYFPFVQEFIKAKYN